MRADMRVVVLAVLSIIVVVHGSAASGLSAIVQPDGSFQLLVAGQQWFSGSEVAIQAAGSWHSNTAGTLKQVGKALIYAGMDTTGAYNATQLTWSIGGTGKTMVTTVRAYTTAPAVAFRQEFPEGLSDTSVWDTDKVISSFPSFSLTGANTGDFGYAAWWNTFIQSIHMGNWWNGTALLPSGKSGGPFAVYDRELRNTVVISPFSEFMAGSVDLDLLGGPGGLSVVRCGVMGGVMELPAGYAYETVAVLGAGPNHAMEAWGSLLLGRYGKSRDGPQFDFTVKNLGYNTDHGSYYYYHTEPNKNYLETLTDVYHYAESAGIPYKMVLLDSWWYFKGDRDGVYNWTAMPDIFPGGNLGIRNLTLTTGWHVIAHNRYWADNTNYAKQNGGDWEFIVESKNQISIPVEEAFWEYLMKSSRKWGLDVYEQDWLYNEFDWMNVTLSNVTIARMWLLQMGNAALRNGVNIQYCMPYPRHAMQSVEIPAVTQIRASNDYVPNSIYQNWHLGYSSILAHALGLAPFKDNFWSSTKQPGNPYDSFEPYPALEACVATFSAGPVTPSDGIGLTNVSLVMRSCASNGMLLQPSKPMTAMDATFGAAFGNSSGAQGQLWSTYSEVGGLRWHHVFAAEMTAAFTVTPAELQDDITWPGSFITYSADTVSFANLKLAAFSSGSPIDIPVCNRSDFQLHHIAPQFASGWALLGELNKWVPVSADRFKEVNATPTSISVEVAGEDGEVVEVSFASPAMAVTTVHITIGSNGRAVWTQSLAA